MTSIEKNMPIHACSNLSSAGQKWSTNIYHFMNSNFSWKLCYSSFCLGWTLCYTFMSEFGFSSVKSPLFVKLWFYSQQPATFFFFFFFFIQFSQFGSCLLLNPSTPLKTVEKVIQNVLQLLYSVSQSFPSDYRFI